MKKINLDNKYYLEEVNSSTKNFNNNAIDIKDLKLSLIKKRNMLLLKIDFKTINEKDYKKYLKKLLIIKNILSFKHYKIGVLNNSERCIGYLINYDKDNKQQNEFLLGINAILYETRYERYNYIYDTVCDYLDNFFYGKNLCDFKDNKCGEKRNTNITIGCCRHCRVKYLGFFTKLVPCEYLKEDKTCGAKCISCKLFTCNYLEKKGIKFRIKDIFLLRVFFNPIQKYFIKFMVFTPKEKIIKRIMLF